jgi:hypothetical protein
MSNIPEEAKRLREMWGGFRTYSMKEIKRCLLESGFKDIKEGVMDETVLIEGF